MSLVFQALFFILHLNKNMFWLIENTTQFEEFKKKNINKAFIEIIPYSPNTHPALNDVSCIYIKPIEDYKGYIIPLNHSEVENNFEYDEVFDLLSDLEIIYCRDKKEFLHYFPIKQTIDITFNINHELTYTKAHEFFYEKQRDLNGRSGLNLIGANRADILNKYIDKRLRGKK